MSSMKATLFLPREVVVFEKSTVGSGAKVGLDSRSDCFTHWQLYVAFSRVTHTKNLTIITKQLDKEEEFDGKIRNIVYPEVLKVGNTTFNQ